MGGSFVKGALIGGLGAALVLVTSAAIAGTGIGAPFNLGETNDVDETSVLAGDKAGGTMLQVTNTSTAPGAEGIGITVGANKAPIHVNSTAGKATFLNADKLDGLDSTGFLPRTGKAADSELLDGRDSTGFLSASGKAADADKLDGLDSSQFLRSASSSFFQRRCENGAVNGYARFDARSDFPTTFTTGSPWVRLAFNCTGGGVIAERLGAGYYRVRFPGLNGQYGLNIAFGTAVDAGTTASLSYYVGVQDSLVQGLTYFDVVTRKYDGSRADIDFALLVPAVAPHL